MTYSEKITFKGSVKYFLDNKYHRVGMPSNKWYDGDKCWYFMGEEHKVNGSWYFSHFDGYIVHGLYGRNISVNIGRLVL